VRERRLVVTGGAGFIGSHLAQRLAEDNEVIILDDFSTGKPQNILEISQLPNVRVVRGSLLDLALLHEAFESVDYVFHLAADPNVVESVENPLRTNEVNITGTLNTLVAARDTKVKKVVYASSSAVYGNASGPNTETMRPDLSSPYALTKLTGEYYCQVFSKIYGLSTVSLRYFNVYGPRQDANSDYAAVIPKFIHRLLKNQPPIIYGDGEQTRDFIFVADVVQGTILAAEQDLQGQAVNIASGESLSINQLADKLIVTMGRNVKPVYAEPQPGDVKQSLADISKARSLISFKPAYSLECGLAETIAYFETISA